MSERITQKQAEQLGYTVDTCCNPPVGYKGPRFRPDAPLVVCYTDLEEEMLREVEALRKQLAARQLQVEQLRNAGNRFKQQVEYYARLNEIFELAPICRKFDTAIAAPFSTDALDAYVMEKQREAYLIGFNSSAEGWNGEYPFGDMNQNPVDNQTWIERRESDLAQQLEAGKDGE